MTGVGLLCEYFLAPNLLAAAATLEWDGPSQPPPGTIAFPTLFLKGVEPTMWMGKLEMLATGRTFDEILSDDWAVVDSGDGGRVVVEISRSLQDVLADLPDDAVVELAERWAIPDPDFGTGGDVEGCTWALTELVELVRQGRQTGSSLYCWVSL